MIALASGMPRYTEIASASSRLLLQATILIPNPFHRRMTGGMGPVRGAFAPGQGPLFVGMPRRRATVATLQPSVNGLRRTTQRKAGRRRNAASPLTRVRR